MKSPQNQKGARITHDSGIKEIAAAVGWTASDLRGDLPIVSFDDDEIAQRDEDDTVQDEQLLSPAEIIDLFQKLGETVPAISHAAQLCINELQEAVQLVSGCEHTHSSGWRLKGMSPHVATAAENTERVAMLLGQAFTIAMSLTSCAGAKAYEGSTLARAEASLEQFSDSPESFKDAVLAKPRKTKSAQAKALNR